jgi:6-pyruvoyltetrahydropterin/6-carboxytetrahydropterin synthase
MGFKVIIDAPKIKFSACHFLKNPEKCSRLHGHNYYVSVEISSELNDDFFVEDFIELKKKIKSIVKRMDHYILIPTEADNIDIKEGNDFIEVLTSNKRYVFPRSDIALLPLPATTTELLAKYIHDKLKEFYKDKKIAVRLKESESNIGVYED